MSALSSKLIAYGLSPHVFGAVWALYATDDITEAQAIAGLDNHLAGNGEAALSVSEKVGLSEMRTNFDGRNNFQKAAFPFYAEKAHQLMVDGEISESFFDGLFGLT